jgi:plastocyanin
MSAAALKAKVSHRPSTPVELNQVDCHYVPHAIVVSVGQTLNVKNSDMTLHNIHAQTVENSALNTVSRFPW